MMFSDPRKNVLEFGFLSGQKIADLGSGAGHYAFALSELLGPNGKVLCVDISKDKLVAIKNEAERQGAENIEVCWGDIEKIGGTGLKDKVCDGCVFSNILFQLTDKKTAILEAKRILKTGGRCGVVEWSDLSIMSGIKHEGEKMIVSKEETVKIFEENGFKLERAFEAGEHHYGLIFGA